MNNALVLGPIVLPYAVLLVGIAAGSMLLVGRHRSGEFRPHVEAALWQTLLVGLVFARLAFVWEFRSAYFAAPIGIVDIRDGGWHPTAGFVAAWLFALSRKAPSPAFQKALRAALMTGTVVWAAGAAVLVVRPQTGQPLPTRSLPALDGLPLQWAAFKGKPTVVNLWATWCPPCVREMPLLHRAQIDSPNVNFVFVNQGESGDAVRAWLQARDLPLRNVLIDASRQVGAEFKQRALPTTLFFDAQGQLVSTRVGELSAATLTQRLQQAHSQ